MTYAPPTQHSRRRRGSVPGFDGDGGQFLAQALSFNAVFSGVTGATLAGGGWLLDAWVGVSPWLVTALGVGWSPSPRRCCGRWPIPSPSAA